MGLVKRGKDLWFYEDLYSDVTYGFKVKRIVVPETPTGFKLMILDTERFGQVLILDGIVQLTEEDEGIYHEWIGLWPLFATPNSGKRLDHRRRRRRHRPAVLRHPGVKSVTMAEIDRGRHRAVPRTHLPGISAGVWDDPRFRLIIGDGAEVIRKMKGQCDVIIIDSTDPVSPAKSLFDTSFYESVYDASAKAASPSIRPGLFFSSRLRRREAGGRWSGFSTTSRSSSSRTSATWAGRSADPAGSRGGTFQGGRAQRFPAQFQGRGDPDQLVFPRHLGRSVSRVPEAPRGRQVRRGKSSWTSSSGRPPSRPRVGKWSRELLPGDRHASFGDPMVSDPAWRMTTRSSGISRRAPSISAGSGIRPQPTASPAPGFRGTRPRRSPPDFSGPMRRSAGPCRGAFSPTSGRCAATLIYRSGASGGRPGEIRRPRPAEAAEIFKPSFRLPVRRASP